jgi:ribose transport system permease protein
MTSPSTQAVPEARGDRPPAATPPAPPGPVGLRSRLSQAATIRNYGILLVFLALFIALAASSSVFLTKTNLLAILDQNAPIGIVAVGTSLVFISGGFDLSIGAAFAFGGIVSAEMVAPFGVPAAFAIGIAAGLGVGLLNGALVTVARINPFVTTLATAIMVGGLATLVHHGSPVFVTNLTYSKLGNNELFGIKWTIIIWVGFSLLCGFLLQRTVFGRYVYSIGGSEEASRLSGVRVAWVRLGCYGLSGLAAAVGGVLIASRASSGEATAGGFSLAVTAVAAVVVGGTSILGGEGAIWRTVVGVLILALIGNGFDLLGVNANLQSLFQGGLILAAVGIDTWARGRG